MKREKPAFLKTFSDFTIQELRVMPLKRLFSLFFQEVRTALSDGPAPKKAKSVKRAKKNTETLILTAKVTKRPTFSFHVPSVHSQQMQRQVTALSEAMKRVFTPT